jgi:hypothetical protein
VGAFWSDIEHHHPAAGTLHLPEEVAGARKRRLRDGFTKKGGARSHSDYVATLTCVRSFYRDLQEWAVQDPSWAHWSYPSPVRKSDTAGQARKVRQKAIADTHQRIRERMPHLPALVESQQDPASSQRRCPRAARAPRWRVQLTVG